MTSDFNLAQRLQKELPQYFGAVLTYDKMFGLDPRKYLGKFIVVNILTETELLTKVGHFVCIDLTFRSKYVTGTQLPFAFDPYGTYNQPIFNMDFPRKLLGVPELNYLMTFLNSIKGGFLYNAFQLQTFKLGNDICGVMSYSYNLQPNFNLNPFFKIYPNLPNLRLVQTMNNQMAEYGISIGLLQTPNDYNKIAKSLGY